MSDVGHDHPAQPTVVNIMARFAQVLAKVGVIVKDQTADVKTYTYKYADINQILHQIKPLLAEVDLAIAQPLNMADDVMQITTLLIDVETGENVSFPGPGFTVKGDPQAVGSSLTYFRRYALVSLFGMEAADDDAAAASRSARDPQNRTAAETEIRKGIAAMEASLRNEFAADFKDHFHSTLTNLPESRHGDALGYFKWWTTGGAEAVAAENAEGAADDGLDGPDY